MLAIVLAAISFFFLCGTTVMGEEDTRQIHQAHSTRGMVVSASPPASIIGRDVLARGGNAVDAAVAVAFAMSVTWPEAGNIGGGGFMMVHVPGSEPICIDYRECAPGKASTNMFAAGESTFTHRASGVPGTVA